MRALLTKVSADWVVRYASDPEIDVNPFWRTGAGERGQRGGRGRGCRPRDVHMNVVTRRSSPEHRTRAHMRFACFLN
jgi:hypothetical protein